MSTTNSRSMNWTGVSFAYTPSGGSLTTLLFDGVQHIDVMDSDTLVPFIGDLGRFKTLLAAKDGNRGMALHCQNVAAMRAIPKGQAGTLTAILNHPVNGSAAGSGALQHVLSNAVLASNPVQTGLNRPGEGVATFVAYSTDGTTDPLVVTTL